MAQEPTTLDPKATAKILELRDILFSDLTIPIDTVKQYLEDAENNPHKFNQYKQLLGNLLNASITVFEEMSYDDKLKIALTRIDEWSHQMGKPSLRELVAMSKNWGLPIDKIFTGKITPMIIKEMLDLFVMGQEEYKMQLSIAFFTYLMKRDNYRFLPKSNLLVCGPSGSGKTYGMQVLSSLFHMPFVLIHCNSLVQEGIVGATLSDQFSSLLENWTPKEVEHTIVCFDEFDKLFEKNQMGNDSGYYNARIINEMLNILDDNGEVECRESLEKYEYKRIRIPTNKMMFVFTGIFEGLFKEDDQPVGFDVPTSDETKKSDNLTTEDFINFGIKPEIMGRIQNFVVIEALSEDQLVQLFDMGPNSPFAEFEQYFANNDISTILTEEGKRTLAHIAYQRKLGVRGLKSLLHQALNEDMYDLEVGDDNILKITRQYIMDNLNK